MSAKYAAIIGVGPGLGMALSSAFYEEGFSLAMLARSTDKLQIFKSKLESKGAKVHCYTADVGNADSLNTALSNMIEDQGIPELVVYNVSLLRQAVPMEIDYDKFVEDFQINVGGMLLTHQKVFPRMLKQGHGTIMVTGGGLALNPYYEFASLGVGKAGLRNLSASLVQEAKDTSIRIYTITINGMIQKGTKFDPALLADKFVDIYKNGLRNNEHEFIIQ